MKKRILCGILALILVLCLTPAAGAANVRLIALTFDDGPSPSITPRLLDALAERGIKATFFLNGKNAEAYPEIVLRQAEEGHQIANHTYSHAYLPSLSDEKIRLEVSRTADYLTELTDCPAPMVRLPYGGTSARVQSLVTDAPIIMWSMDPTDGKYNPGPNAAQMQRNIVNAAHDGAILLMHDTNEKNLTAVLGAIDELLEQGYDFVTLNELFRLKGITPQNGVIYYSAKNPGFENFDETRLWAHWAGSYIRYVSGRGIMTGDGTGFHPNCGLTRAEAVTVLWRMAGSPDSFGRAVFRDVPLSRWYFKAVAWAARTGIVNGVSAERFCPNDAVTREQFYVMLARYAALSETGLSASETPVSYRDDSRIGVWAASAVDALRRSGFSSENDVELFRPGDAITRAEAAELLKWIDERVTPPADLLQDRVKFWTHERIFALRIRGRLGAALLGGIWCTEK